MKILVACEYSGVVRDAFTRAGHHATSCDILPSETPGKHYQGDVLEILNDGWDAMIAFPPCTHLAVSGAAWFEQKRKDGRQQKGIDFFMKLVNAPIGIIAIENPVGIMSTLYRKPDQIVHPYFFGDAYSKSTCFWLKNLPRLFHSKENDLFATKTHVEPEYILCNSKKNKSGKSKYSKFAMMGKGKSKERSLTPKGLADAIGQQWGKYLFEITQR